MDKRSFLNNFASEDRNMLASLYEEVELCKKIDYPVYTKMFFPPQIWNNLENMKNALGIEVESKGLTQDSEKRVILLKPKGFGGYDEAYPFVYFELKGGSKFKELEHRHFLASIMGLGIKREMLGDLVVRKGVCYGVILDDLYGFLESNLLTIGRIDVSIRKIEEQDVPEMEFEEGVYPVSSLRLDSVVAAVTDRSRTIASELIKDGYVSINYSVKREKDLVIKKGDVMTIRKKGKFIFKEVAGTSKKGKHRLILNKYN